MSCAYSHQFRDISFGRKDSSCQCVWVATVVPAYSLQQESGDQGMLKFKYPYLNCIFPVEIMIASNCQDLYVCI